MSQGEGIKASIRALVGVMIYLRMKAKVWIKIRVKVSFSAMVKDPWGSR